MPQYRKGVLVQPETAPKRLPVGRLFIQPKVLTEDGREVLLDEVIGANFAIIAWGTDPTWGLSAEQVAFWRNLGTRFIQVLPAVQMKGEREVDEAVIRIGDCSNRLKTWFGNYPASVVILRPDRFVAALAVPQTLGKVCSALRQALSALAPGQPVDRAGALRKVA